MRPGRYIYNMKKKHLTQSFDSLIAKPPTPQWAQIGKKVQQIMDFSVVAGFFQRVKSTFFFQIFFFKNFLREDRRRGIHGHDYGEDDDEIDYSKKYDDDTALLVIILDFYF